MKVPLADVTVKLVKTADIVTRQAMIRNTRAGAQRSGQESAVKQDLRPALSTAFTKYVRVWILTSPGKFWIGDDKALGGGEPLATLTAPVLIHVSFCTVFQKRKPPNFLAITFSNLNRFSKFFHC